MLIGYARVSTSGQDLAAQRDGLAPLGVDDQHVHVDHGLSGTTRARPGLREALAACRAGDVLVVTKLDRLARSLRDATDIADELTKKGVALNIGGAVYDPTDPVGRLLFNVLGMLAEFEADLIRARTRKGMAIAKAAGKLRGRKPKLTASQERTSCSCTAPAPIRRARSRSSSASPARRSIVPSSGRRHPDLQGAGI
jgi:DNA invertase Pin-like site-specific DNA recombinase